LQRPRLTGARVASPESIEAADFVRRLVARGISQRTIGAAVGRNDSLISQIGRGTGKGGSLRDRLGELLATAERAGLGKGATPEQLAAGGQEPARRTRRTGTIARVRRAVSARYGGGGSTSQVKRQAAHAGGNGLIYELRRAADEDMQVAWDVTFRDPANEVQVIESSGRPRPKADKTKRRRRHGLTVTMRAGARESLDAVEAAGSVTRGVLRMMIERGLINYEDEDEAIQDVEAIEMRVWSE
jgi:hypothetical protein